MAEKVEKAKQNAQTKHIPKDAQVIMSIMRDMEINDYEPRVINQLLEFTYRYVACILEDAKAYANHAKKRSIDLDDVKLALQIQLEQAFTTAPPRELLTEMARTKNSIQLPLIKPHCGIRLPQDRHCLSSSNLKIKLPQVTKKGIKITGSYSGNIADRGIKIASKGNVAVVKRTSGMPIASRAQTVTIPKPVTKFTSAPPKTVVKPKINISQSATPISLEDDHSHPSTSNILKRKREDDDYDMNL